MENTFTVEKVRNPTNPSYKDSAFGFLFIAQVVVVIGLAFSFGIMALESTYPKTVTVVNDNSGNRHNNIYLSEACLLIDDFDISYPHSQKLNDPPLTPLLR